MKKQTVVMLIALIIVIGFTQPVGPLDGGQISPLGEGGIGKF
ncbi:hypothetical protein [Paenibacillus glacialis]|nr:hypothetical protein [Paenibacillus glacialis]